MQRGWSLLKVSVFELFLVTFLALGEEGSKLWLFNLHGIESGLTILKLLQLFMAEGNEDIPVIDLSFLISGLIPEACLLDKHRDTKRPLNFLPRLFLNPK